MNLSDFQTAVAALPFGKTLPTARYIYAPDESMLPEPFATLVSKLRQRLALDASFNIIKLSPADYAISFLRYPEFLTDAHPAIAESVRIQLATGTVKRTDFTTHSNQPILHRKECFLPPRHPKHRLFAALTRAEEEAGLYEEPSHIGFRANWESLLKEKGVQIKGHALHPANPADSVPSDPVAHAIHRHRTALSRSELSKPVRVAMECGLFSETDTVFDFGCGLGTDVAGLRAMGVEASGWDPAFFPSEAKRKAQFVNLGFVLNVIERPAERVSVLRDAWALAGRVLLVSTLVHGQEEYSCIRPHADGYLTSRDTFQKYFEPAELQALIEHALESEAFPVGLGIYAVFRDPRHAQDWLARRTRRVIDWETLSRRLGFLRPRIQRQAVDLYELHRDLLDACWNCMLDLGRFPTAPEFPQFDEIRSKVGTPRKIHQIFLTRFGEATFEAARAQRRDDLLAYLALANFRKKVPLKYLSDRLQGDIRSFFGTYESAILSSREILFAAGDSRNIEAACEAFPFGCQDDDALQIHRSLLTELPAVLRIYVLCAARVYGDPDEADIIKIHKHSGKVTFQYYDGFFENSFPLMLWRIKVNLRRQSADVFDHRQPPYQQLLCFKERFLGPDHPDRLACDRLAHRLRRLNITPESAGYGLAPEILAELRARYGLTESLMPKKKLPPA
jgi:DNA phosphorothioation-associated putative methyltransferase